MSADNYIFVRKRDDGRFGVSMRFASNHYSDDDGTAGVPDEWIGPAPDDSYGVFDTAEEAIMAAHRAEAAETVVEYGVVVGAGVLD